MIIFQTWPAPETTCLNCVHHAFEENQEAEPPYVLVCFLRRKPIQLPEQAKDCLSYYSEVND